MAKSGGGSGSWLLTYADFITLMMIFFIVLYTLTPGVEQNKFEAIIGAFQGKRAVLKYNAPVSLNEESTEMQRARNWDAFYQRIQEENLQDHVQIELIPEGVLITLGEAALFETYSVNLLPDAHSLLMDVANGIENYTFEEVELVDIQGHTDNRRVVSGSFRKYESNWELGAGRALAVMEFIHTYTSLPLRSYSISSFGEHRPLVPNTSPENMQKNRRVEVLIKYQLTDSTTETDTET